MSIWEGITEQLVSKLGPEAFMNMKALMQELHVIDKEQGPNAYSGNYKAIDKEGQSLL